jgi:hypothetical protein
MILGLEMNPNLYLKKSQRQKWEKVQSQKMAIYIIINAFSVAREGYKRFSEARYNGLSVRCLL